MVDTTNSSVRTGTNKDDIVPEERRSVLDKELLIKMGLTEHRMKSQDALFFWQLIFPICDPLKSGIENDPQKAFYTLKVLHTNTYAVAEKKWGGCYGHNFTFVTEPEMVHWDGVLIRDGARGGTGGSIHIRWIQDDPDFDHVIANSMKYSRWLQIKAVIKLNDNRATSSTRGTTGDDDYDPCAKYDLVFKCLVGNVNAIRKRAALDLCLDETTWANIGYSGEALYRIHGKPGVNKGGQMVI